MMPTQTQPSPVLTAGRHRGLDNCIGSGQGGRDVEPVMNSSESRQLKKLDRVQFGSDPRAVGRIVEVGPHAIGIRWEDTGHIGTVHPDDMEAFAQVFSRKRCALCDSFPGGQCPACAEPGAVS